MPRYKGTTTQRGLGAEHQAARRRALAHLTANPGQPCLRCGQPMTINMPLDYDHQLPRALGGASGPRALAHRHCNRSHGARLGNKLRASQRPASSHVSVVSEQW